MSIAGICLLDAEHPDPDLIAHAAAMLRRGELVAFPTETVYGLGANLLDHEAVARIYVAKGRPAWNPVIAHVANTDAAIALTRFWPQSAQRLADALWPGPITLVLPKRADVPDIATAGLDAVAVRVPAHPVALALLRAARVPVAAPSANRFTQVSPTTAQHVRQSLGGRVSLILDGGPCTVGIESTVIDLTGDVPMILRPGMLTAAALEAVLGVPVATRVMAPVAHDAASGIPAPRSPGMADRHYAPAADVWLFDPAQRHEIERALAGRTDSRDDVRALLRNATFNDDALSAANVHRMPDDPAAYARALYGALHEADAAQATLVLIERPPAEPAWQGVLDRLTRAAR